MQSCLFYDILFHLIIFKFSSDLLIWFLDQLMGHNLQFEKLSLDFSK